MPYTIQQPKKKGDAYMSTIRDAATQKPVILRLSGCHIQIIQELRAGFGYLLKIHVPTDVAHPIQELDEACKAAVLENNGSWFSNNLAEREIEEFYRPSCGQTSLQVVALHSKPPREVVWCGESLPSISDIPQDINLASFVASIVIEAQGLFFYPKRFGVRWLLRNIKVARTDDIDIEQVDETASRREEIEAYWTAELATAAEKMSEDIRRYEEKIDMIRNIQAHLYEVLEGAKTMPVPQKEWNEALESLASKIWAYTNGQESRFILF
jgi:hypothetical protein